MAEADASNAPIAQHETVANVIHGVRYASLPSAVVQRAKDCLLDLIGVAAAGSRTRLGAIVARHAASELCASEHHARILFDGRASSRAGAAFAGASTIDAFDAHDGHVLTKGHAGVAALPALLAFADDARDVDGHEFLTCLVLGYEIGTRAGMALHASAADYHCSGAWNALACAAIGARRLALDAERTRHALGIAEYFGTRGQMLRVCATPSMLKDGSGWGAHAGVTATLLASEGFTGAPAVTAEAEDIRSLWVDLGNTWRILEQYFKTYPVCRWAQPAIEAALALAREHSFAAQDIEGVSIETFREAIVLGSRCSYPRSTEEAQYSLAHPVAAALANGTVGAREIADENLADPQVVRLFEATSLVEDAQFSRAFPRERWARVRIALRDGRSLVSQPHQARGGSEIPMSSRELRTKYRDLAEPVLGTARARRIEAIVAHLDTQPAGACELLDLLLASIPSKVIR